MPNRMLFVPIVLIAIGIAGLSVTAFTMAPMMDGWHWGMMGGRGSDPAEEAPVAGVTQVRIEDFAFSPANIVVEAGATVTWKNYDEVGHTVTTDEGDTLDGSTLDEGESFNFTFREPGEYAYHCSPHPNMKGLVTVRAESEGR